MGVPNLARAAVSSLVRGRPSSAPGVVLAGTFRARPERLRAYAQVCGFSPRTTMPVTYPHVLAFDLAMRLMTRRDFPFALPGLVHIRNTITVHRPIEAGEALTFHVRAGDVREHPKGRTVDVVTSAELDDAVCWTECSTYLHRERTPRPPADAPRAAATRAADVPRATEATRATDAPTADTAAQADPLPAAATWHLPATLGRRYARVSGDWNPIHLSALTARLFGFRRPIAHGMWTMARVLSEIDTLPDAFTVNVAFAAPIPLPSRIAFATDGERITVRPVNALDARPHVTGNIAAQ